MYHAVGWGSFCIRIRGSTSSVGGGERGCMRASTSTACTCLLSLCARGWAARRRFWQHCVHRLVAEFVSTGTATLLPRVRHSIKQGPSRESSPDSPKPPLPLAPGNRPVNCGSCPLSSSQLLREPGGAQWQGGGRFDQTRCSNALLRPAPYLAAPLPATPSPAALAACSFAAATARAKGAGVPGAGNSCPPSPGGWPAAPLLYVGR